MHGLFTITANLVALIFVSLSDLTQDQRQVLTSLMAHRNRVLADYRMNELREVYLEIFCTTRTSVDNPLSLPQVTVAGKPSWLLKRATWTIKRAIWVEDEEDGAEGFLEADEDTFWVYDEDNYTLVSETFSRKKNGSADSKASAKAKARAERDPEEGASSEEKRQIESSRQQHRPLASRRTMAR